MMTDHGIAAAGASETAHGRPSDRSVAGCAEPPPSLLIRGIEQFNAGAYWDCHETLETLWRQEARPVRGLYQGILQIGVGFLHGRRGNLSGPRKALRRGLMHLRDLPELCQGVHVAELRRAGQAVLDRIMAAAPDDLAGFALEALPRVTIAGRDTDRGAPA
jgi:hypothetical protein